MKYRFCGWSWQASLFGKYYLFKLFHHLDKLTETKYSRFPEEILPRKLRKEKGRRIFNKLCILTSAVTTFLGLLQPVCILQSSNIGFKIISRLWTLSSCWLSASPACSWWSTAWTRRLISRFSSSAGAASSSGSWLSSAGSMIDSYAACGHLLDFHISTQVLNIYFHYSSDWLGKVSKKIIFGFFKSCSICGLVSKKNTVHYERGKPLFENSIISFFLKPSFISAWHLLIFLASYTAIVMFAFFDARNKLHSSSLRVEIR